MPENGKRPVRFAQGQTVITDLRTRCGRKGSDMSDCNRVVLIGHLSRDAQLCHTARGIPVVNLMMVTKEHWRDPRSGEKKKKNEWHRVIVWGQDAEIASKSLKKGGAVYVEGSLQSRGWTDRQGTKRYATEIRASKVKSLDERMT